MKHIIHISDTHLNDNVSFQKFEAVLRDIVDHPAHSPHSHMIIHTGDLLDSHHARCIEQAGQLLEMLSAKGYRLLLAPGNHDYGGFWSVSRNLAKSFRRRFKRYIYSGQNEEFPVVTTMNDVLLIGLDSNLARLKYPRQFFAQGRLGKEQLAKLSTTLTERHPHVKRVVVYLHHNPFWFDHGVSKTLHDGHVLFNTLTRLTNRFRRLDDSASLMTTLMDRADILLFGHQHFGLNYSALSAQYGVKLALDGGASTGACASPQNLKYRIVDLESFSVQTRFVPYGRP